MVISHQTNGFFASVDVGHWLRVRKAREEQGTYRPSPSRGRIENHPMQGLSLTHQDGKVYTVQSVSRDFLAGWFETVLLVDASGSHASHVLRNISSLSPDITRQADAFAQNFLVGNEA